MVAIITAMEKVENELSVLKGVHVFYSFSLGLSGLGLACSGDFNLEERRKNGLW